MAFFSKVYGSWNEIQKEKYEKILEIMKEYRIKFSGNIIDVGCGPFYFEKFLEENGVGTKNFVCIDTEKQHLSRENFIVARGESLPFPKNHFNLLFCIDSIHMIKDASEFHRILKKGGFLIVSSFFNPQTFEKTDSMLDKKLNGFKIISKTILKGKENEIIVIAKK